MAKALADRCAIITGASQGLGFEIARKYLEAGANLVICARDESLLEKSSQTLRQYADNGRSLIALPADISDSRDAAMLVDTALKEFGHLEILVNNAAVAGPCGAIESVDWDEWVHAIEINLMGPVLLSRAVLPHFKGAGYGKFIESQVWYGNPMKYAFDLAKAKAHLNWEPKVALADGLKETIAYFKHSLAL